MAVSSSIDSFKAQVASDFARPNLFQVDLAFPGKLNLGAGDKAAAGLTQLGQFTVRAANLPSSQMGVVEVPYRGRVLKIAGDRTFEPWTITVMNDANFSLRFAFEQWVEAIQAANENYTALATLGDENDSTGYFADMKVMQLSRSSKQDKDGPKTVAEYKFYNVFPSNVSAIDLDFGSNDAIEEFTVELQVQYWQNITKGSST